MSARRLLLIDPDENFFHILHEQVSPYGFEIYRVEPNPDALGYVDDLSPELVFIAVEEPDKLGYSLCNKAKKGVARDIPVVLTTSSVPPSGFLSHRKLRVHADEYIDKRSMTTEELITKMDQLVGLGELAVDDGVFDEFDMELDEAFEEEGERTRIAPPGMFNFDFDDEAGAAVDALVSDVDIFTEHEPEPTVMAAPPMRPQSRPPAPRPAPRPAPSAPPARSSRPSGQLRAPTGAPPSRPSSRPPSPAPAPAPAPDPQMAQRVRDMEAEVQRLRAFESDSKRLHSVEAENQRLQQELTQARSSASAGGGGGGGFSREREFLNLREKMNKKEREVLDLRDELGAKERAILDGKEKVRQLEHAKMELDARNLEMEQRLLDLQMQAESAERDKREAEEKIASLDAAVAEAKGASQAATNAAEARHREQMAGAQKRFEQGKQAALNELRQQLQEESRNAVGAAKDELEALRKSHEKALEELTAKHDSALQAMDAKRTDELASAKERHETAIGKLKEEHQQALAKQEEAASDKAAKDLTRFTEESGKALEQKEAALREEFAGEKAALEKSHEQAMAEMQADLGKAGERIEALEKTVSDSESANQESAAAAAAHQESLGKLEAKLSAVQAEAAELEGQNTSFQEQVLRAYKKIKSDAATVAKAKKALAIALTLLDDNIGEAELEAEAVKQPQ